MKKIKNTAFWVLIFTNYALALGITTVFWAEIKSDDLAAQSASGSGSNWSTIQIVNNADVEYWNSENNSTIIWNTLKWYYYDTVHGFFELDWSTTNINQNVRIVSSTPACDTGYGYKFWGYAYSDTAGFIDFNYSDDIFVYYCEDDQQLHGYAYSKMVGFQNFEWVSFSLNPTVEQVQTATGSSLFLNDSTKIDQSDVWNNNANNYFWGDIVEMEDDKETIFYIIK